MTFSSASAELWYLGQQNGGFSDENDQRENERLT
jgi:hypothetical protein